MHTSSMQLSHELTKKELKCAWHIELKYKFQMIDKDEFENQN